MALFGSRSGRLISRRRFFKTGIFGAAGLAIYSGEIERHWVEVIRNEVHLRGLPAAFEGMRIAQLSDIHLDEYTEPFFLHHVVDLINQMQPDAIFLTGDFVSGGSGSNQFA